MGAQSVGRQRQRTDDRQEIGVAGSSKPQERGMIFLYTANLLFIIDLVVYSCNTILVFQTFQRPWSLWFSLRHKRIRKVRFLTFILDFSTDSSVLILFFSDIFASKIDMSTCRSVQAHLSSRHIAIISIKSSFMVRRFIMTVANADNWVLLLDNPHPIYTGSLPSFFLLFSATHRGA